MALIEVAEVFLPELTVLVRRLGLENLSRELEDSEVPSLALELHRKEWNWSTVAKAEELYLPLMFLPLLSLK